MTIRIRRAQFGDERAIHEAHMRSICELCSKDYTPEQIAVWGKREFNASHRKHAITTLWVWVIEDEQGLIKGFGQLGKNFVDNEDVGDIRALYLTPEVCGQGLGRQLIALMEVIAAANGWKRMICESTLTSKGFYEACGFEGSARIELDWDGVKIPCYPMTKKL